MDEAQAMNGHPLRVLRCQYDLSIAELARETGLSGATISRAENGQQINADSRRLLVKFFGKTSSELGLLTWEQQLRGVPDLPPSTNSFR